MPKFQELICHTKTGLYCPPAGFHIDPLTAVDRAVITHGHGDHARKGHGSAMATRETLAIMGCRYGENFAGSTRALAYGEEVTCDGVAGYDRVIYVHGALAGVNALYESFGIGLGALLPATMERREKLEGEIVIAPPSAIVGQWLRRFADPLPAFASG